MKTMQERTIEKEVFYNELGKPHSFGDKILLPQYDEHGFYMDEVEISRNNVIGLLQEGFLFIENPYAIFYPVYLELCLHDILGDNYVKIFRNSWANDNQDDWKWKLMKDLSDHIWFHYGKSKSEYKFMLNPVTEEILQIPSTCSGDWIPFPTEETAESALKALHKFIKNIVG